MLSLDDSGGSTVLDSWINSFSDSWIGSDFEVSEDFEEDSSGN